MDQDVCSASAQFVREMILFVFFFSSSSALPLSLYIDIGYRCDMILLNVLDLIQLIVRTTIAVMIWLQLFSVDDWAAVNNEQLISLSLSIFRSLTHTQFPTFGKCFDH